MTCSGPGCIRQCGTKTRILYVPGTIGGSGANHWLQQTWSLLGVSGSERGKCQARKHTRILSGIVLSILRFQPQAMGHVSLQTKESNVELPHAPPGPDWSFSSHPDGCNQPGHSECRRQGAVPDHGIVLRIKSTVALSVPSLYSDWGYGKECLAWMLLQLGAIMTPERFNVVKLWVYMNPKCLSKMTE